MSRKSSTETLVAAMRVLASDIQSGDGVANAAIAEAADRLEEQAELIGDVRALANKALTERNRFGLDVQNAALTGRVPEGHPFEPQLKLVARIFDEMKMAQARVSFLEENGPEMQRGVDGVGNPWMGTMRQVLEDYKTAAATEAKLGDEARAALDDLRISRRTLRDKVLDLMARYWELAYREGAEGINLADEANEVIHAVRNLLAGGA